MAKRDLPKYRSKLRRPQPGEKGYRKPPKIQIQPRDIEILDICFQHKFLSSKQIYALVKGSEGRLKKRLQLLWLNRYLERPPEQEILRVRRDLRYLLYALGDRGAKILAERKGYDIEKIKWTQRSEVRFDFIQHTLFTSQFYTCLELALRKREDMELFDWRQGKEIEDRIKRPPYLRSRESRAERPLIRPDGLFEIHYLDGDLRQFFYLEADRGTVREKTMSGRYKKYYSYWEQRGYVKQGIPEDLGFRVLTVSTNPTRAENLRKLIKENEPWDGETSMFWFTHEQWDIDNPDPILGKVWKTARDEKFHSIAD